jgi:hypothetical protein
VRRAAAALGVALLAGAGPRPAAAAPAALALLPQPASVVAGGCTLRAAVLTVPRSLDPGARDLVDERFAALGIPALQDAPQPAVSVRVGGAGAPQSYRLTVDATAVRVDAADADGAFYALATLAQLARPGLPGVAVPCVRIEDAPALKWRILSDDVSRGPLPAMDYFKRRIRTVASFKMNGYSPYMEHVFVAPGNALPAPLDGITPEQLHDLAAYAARFHVAFIPEQQTFAHMHNTLKWERYAPLAELPHGYLLAPANPGGDAYVEQVIDAELKAVPHPPFFHIGSDEPSDLGRGQSKATVASDGAAQAFAAHVQRTVAMIAPSGARPLLWDDAVQAQPQIFALLPKSVVLVNWHYGANDDFAKYVGRIAAAGFDQMVAPGANNWNEIYPDLDVALPNIERFVAAGKSARVLGLFQTVWHDDGETIYEDTWYPVLFAAANAWQTQDLGRDAFADLFAPAFFGSPDPRYAADVAALAKARTLLRAAGSNDAGDYLFWADPLDPKVRARMANVDLAALRLTVEPVIEHLRGATPPLHRDAANAMYFAARRYDALARAFQIGGEARAYYDDARANVGVNENYVYRGLYVAKYLFWEERDALLELAGLARATWEAESRQGHESSVLLRYAMAAQRAQARADAIDRATVETYEKTHAIPPFDDALDAVPAAALPR